MRGRVKSFYDKRIIDKRYRQLYDNSAAVPDALDVNSAA